ncbi:hypothetical protein GGF32_002817 [Allomyces javanicus]|nr:hypothetical protein GGF32_002817 [Allomyces javanicus]
MAEAMRKTLDKPHEVPFIAAPGDAIRTMFQNSNELTGAQAKKLFNHLKKSQIKFFKNDDHELFDSGLGGIRMVLNMIDTPGLNDTESAHSPITDLLHLTGTLQEIRNLPGGHLHVIIYVIKYTTAFSSAFLKAIDTYLSNLAPICNKVIIVHSGYNPLDAIRNNKQYLDLSERIRCLSELLANKTYFDKIEIMHLPMNNILNMDNQDPAHIAFAYQQRDRLLQLITNCGKHTARTISSLDVVKPQILKDVTAIVQTFAHAKCGGFYDFMARIGQSTHAKEAHEAIRKVAEAKSKVDILTRDLFKIDNKELTHDDRCWEIEDLFRSDERSVSVTCQSYFWRGLTMRVSAYSWSCEFHASKIRLLRKERKAAQQQRDILEAQAKNLEHLVQRDLGLIRMYQKEVQRMATAAEYLQRDSVPLDLILNISSSDTENPKVLNRMVKEIHEGRTPSQANLDELFQAYIDYFGREAELWPIWNQDDFAQDVMPASSNQDDIA